MNLISVPVKELELPNKSNWMLQVLTLYTPLIIWCTIFFSPLIAYSLALFILIIRTNKICSNERILMGVFVAFAGAVIISSRSTGAEGDDLTEHYYPIYLEMTSGRFSSFFKWGWGLEIGINVLNALFALALPRLSESGYAFFIALLSGSFFVIVVEKYLLTECAQSIKAVSTAVIYAMFSIYFSTQLCRQFLAGLFLIVALFESRKKVIYSALLVSAIFHLSSIPLYIFYKAAAWFRLNRFYLFIPMVFVTYLLINFMEPLLKLISAGLPDTRLLYYAEGDALSSNIMPFKYLLVVLASIVMLLLTGSKQLTEREKSWVSIYLIVVTFYYMTLNFRLLPARAFLMVHGMLLGWFFIMMYRKLSVHICIIISLFVVTFFIQGKFFVNEKLPHALWYQFDSFSFIPGYFVLDYFK